MTMSPTAPRQGKYGAALLVTALVIVVGSGLTTLRSIAQDARAVPAPAVDEPAAPGGPTSEVAVLAGGCFWGVQGVFQHVVGVTNAVSGYAGGEKSAARYEV